jgi:ubiquinone/menaquinone biosynthesis C-methylase UbiE
MTTRAVDSLPSLARRSDGAYLDFVEGLREFILGKGADFEDRLNQALIAEAERRAEPWQDIEQIREFVQQQPLGCLRDRMARTQQQMKWYALARSFNDQREQLLAELNEWLPRGPGKLLLDPDFVPPSYVNVHFHLQPGGYFKDELSGFLYHWGTKVFFRGDNDTDQLHARLTRMVPTPADGRVKRILDMACSVGQSTTAFSRRFPAAHVWGVDYSAPMLKVAHRRAAMLGDNVTFKQALIEKTGFDDEYFDITFAFIVFHELPVRIIEETVREAARVTRKGGVFAVFDFARTADKSPFQRYHRWFDARHNGEPYSQDFCDYDFDALLKRCGFSVGATPLGQRSGGSGYMQNWFAVRE